MDVARSQTAEAELNRRPTEDGTFTHSLLVRMLDPRGMHARPAAFLFCYLRRAAPGTRVAFELGGRLFDLGECSRVSVGAILKLMIRSGDEVRALASGPDAENVLFFVAEVFAFQPGQHMRDWRRISKLLGGPGGHKEAQQLMGEIRQGYYESCASADRAERVKGA